MSCLENFLNKPVLLQLGDPVVAAHSSEWVELEKDEAGESVACGRAIMTLQEQPALDNQGRRMVDPNTGHPAIQRQPVLVQVLVGEIVALSADGLMFSTIGGDGKTQVISYFPKENIRAVTFATEHVPMAKPEDPPKIISPN